MGFKRAVNESAYAKVGIFGLAGAGKTFSACDIAIGLYKHCKYKKPVFFLDTETGSDWLLPRFRQEKIELHTNKSRAFKDLISSVKDAEKDASILIVDSVTHFWNEMIESFLRSKGLRRLAIFHWTELKQNWRTFSELFINSKIHIIVCGRAGYEYDTITNEDGSVEISRGNTKMKAESEFGFEPSLVLEMVREKESRDPKAKTVHNCYVRKDRRTDEHSLDGKVIPNPTFESFLPHIEWLNLGGTHLGVDNTKNSTAMFQPDGESYASKARKKKIIIEEMDGVFNNKFTGSTKKEKVAIAAIKKKVFGSYSDTFIEGMKAEDLESGLVQIKQVLQDDTKIEQIIAEQKAGGKQ